jgi:hypothetical protein
MIIWSDDCLSCLCNLPHSEEKHMQEVNKAMSETQEQREAVRADNPDLFDDETDTARVARKAISPAALASLIKSLETSLYGF